MAFERNPIMLGDNGIPVRYYPYHISMKGMESLVICRDDEDYDIFVKTLHIKGHILNVHRVMYCVVSNHSHIIVLSESKEKVERYCLEIKRVYSMYLHKKYHLRSALGGVDMQAISLDSDWYLRNALAYTLRNALDNGALNILNYKWSGARAIFCNGHIRGKVRKVSELGQKGSRMIMKSHENLKDTKWSINESNELEPASCCLWRYFESAFKNDHSFFIKVLGNVNMPEMEQKLVENPRNRYNDSEMVNVVNDVCERWFAKSVSSLPIEKKLRVCSYIYRNHKTTLKQLARIAEIDREILEKYF